MEDVSFKVFSMAAAQNQVSQRSEGFVWQT
jgi:hypothetical protein